MKLNKYQCKHCNKFFYIEAEGINYEHMWCPRCQKRTNLEKQDIEIEYRDKNKIKVESK